MLLAVACGDGGSASTESACRQVGQLAADVRDNRLDGDDWHGRLVEIADTAAAGHDEDVSDAAEAVLARADDGPSMGALDPVAQACLDGGYG